MYGLMGVHALPKEEEVTHVELPTNTSTGPPADDRGLDLRQIAFLVIWEDFEELFANDEPKDPVAKELQAFVRGQARVCARGVREGGAQEFRLAKAVVDRFL